MRRGLAAALAGAVVACSLGCGGGPAPGPRAAAVDRRDVLAGVADRGILVLTEALATRAGALCPDPTQQKRHEVRAAWAGARAAYRATEAFGFGPVDELRLARAMDFTPVREDAVQALLTGAEPLSPEALARIGATVRGFGVLERLLFEGVGDEGAALAALAGSPRRCAYVMALAEDLSMSGAALARAWRPAGGDFRGALVEAGRDPRGFMSQRAALSAVLEALVGVATRAEEELARPLGRLDGGGPRPEAALARASGHGLAEIRAWLGALELLYQARSPGLDGVGLMELVASVDTPLSLRVQGALTAAVAALDAVPGPLDQAVLTAPAAVEAARVAAHEVLLYLAVDVAARLGVTLTFSDNDGD